MDVLLLIEKAPAHQIAIAAVVLASFILLGLYTSLHFFAPKPRDVFPSEKTYQTSGPKGKGTSTGQLPCWYDRWAAERQASEKKYQEDPSNPSNLDTGAIEPAELRMSVVFPAYNEEDRILPTLKEAVEYLDATFGRTGYEIIIVDDGSKDRTVEIALRFARENDLHHILRVVTLKKNRGKGGAVTHGLRHVRGEYALFADADGASKFSDLGKLIAGCEFVMTKGSRPRGVAIGSRAHLVGSDAVVKRSALRNFLMRSFHLVLTILTPPATSRLRDTQCGFKLFSRASLPHIVPYMHAEGWIFDIEMLMLAESAPAAPVLDSDGEVIGETSGIKVAEIFIDWHEVGGSKLNVIQDSIRMAIGLAVLRASWMMGVYRRRLV